jgi:hypothetical protein
MIIYCMMYLNNKLARAHTWARLPVDITLSLLRKQFAISITPPLLGTLTPALSNVFTSALK